MAGDNPGGRPQREEPIMVSLPVGLRAEYDPPLFPSQHRKMKDSQGPIAPDAAALGLGPPGPEGSHTGLAQSRDEFTPARRRTSTAGFSQFPRRCSHDTETTARSGREVTPKGIHRLRPVFG